MSADVVQQPVPKRGGFIPSFGPFMGGGTLTKDYRMVDAEFKCVSQLRSVKQLQIIQSTLEQARLSSTSLKFHGNIELDDSKASTELDKKNFVKRLEHLVKTHGFQAFFTMKGPDGTMKSLLTHSHLFTLTDVIAEHRGRASPHVEQYDQDGAELPESVMKGFSKYDTYELLDCQLSRLAVESLVGEALQDDIETRFSHLEDFHDLPENIKNFATEALRLIKVMEGGYALPCNLGSDLLTKVYSTSCEHFNRWVHAKLDEVLELETRYKLKDPKLMVNDADYATLGPVALCAFLQEQYGRLITRKMWPALSTSLPKSNLTSIASEELSSVRACFKCGATDHLRDKCPQLGRGGRGRGRGRGRNGNDGADSTSNITDTLHTTSDSSRGGGHSTSDATRMADVTSHTAFPPWRYIKPADPSVAITIGNVTYKWCNECRCRATGTKGYYTTSHFTSEHTPKSVSFQQGSGGVVNHSEVNPLVALADDSFLPDSIPDDEVLVFSGPWHCSVVDVSENSDLPLAPSAWLTVVDSVPDVLTVGATSRHEVGGGDAAHPTPMSLVNDNILMDDNVTHDSSSANNVSMFFPPTPLLLNDDCVVLNHSKSAIVNEDYYDALDNLPTDEESPAASEEDNSIAVDVMMDLDDQVDSHDVHHVNNEGTSLLSRTSLLSTFFFVLFGLVLVPEQDRDRCYKLCQCCVDDDDPVHCKH